MKAIAEKEGRSVASVLIPFALQRGTVVIPKIVTEKRIQQNLEATCAPLSEHPTEKLLAILKGGIWIPENTQGPIKCTEHLAALF